MSKSVDWRALADELGTITFTDDGRNERGGSDTASNALNLIVGNAIGADAADYYLSHEPGNELARSVLRMLRPTSAIERCLEVFRSAPDSDSACDAMELLRAISNRGVLDHFDEFMRSQNSLTRTWAVGMLDDLWMAGHLEIEDGKPYLERVLSDPDCGVVARAKDLKEMWDEEEAFLNDEDKGDADSKGRATPVYMISRMTIHDRAEYDKYEAQFMDIFDKFEGAMLSVDEEPQVIGGEWKATRSVLIEFPDKPKLFAWLLSDEYKAIGKHRDAGSTAESIIVRGLEDMA